MELLLHSTFPRRELTCTYIVWAIPAYTQLNGYRHDNTWSVYNLIHLNLKDPAWEGGREITKLIFISF